MKDTILLVVDVQNAIITEHPYNEEEVIQNIKRIISISRNSGTEVIYVRHDDGIGGDLERGTQGWGIYNEVAPREEEKIFDKQYNSAFLQTGLKDYLDTKKVKTIILVGMQTEYCIDTTCKVAFEHGFNILIPQETNTTFDNQYLSGEKIVEYYNYKIWNTRFARLVTVDELEKQLLHNG